MRGRPRLGLISPWWCSIWRGLGLGRWCSTRPKKGSQDERVGGCHILGLCWRINLGEGPHSINPAALGLAVGGDPIS